MYYKDIEVRRTEMRVDILPGESREMKGRRYVGNTIYEDKS